MLDLTQFTWLNEPPQVTLTDDRLTFNTLPDTDYWQRTHYGFQRDNGHSFVMPMPESFTFSVKTAFSPSAQYDQCGLILYLNQDAWAKVSTEYEDEEISQLGSVVTNFGYSDWATTYISSKTTVMHYRLSNNGNDFLAESSEDGEIWKQMRVFHLHANLAGARIGVYACSPMQKTNYTVTFSEFAMTPSIWK